MNWYYVDAGQQAGPVDDAQLEELIRGGKIQPDTLVWREGMANWQPYGEVAPGVSPAGAPPASEPPAAGAPPVEAVCAECNRIFDRNNMIRYGDLYICSGCKPVFMQKLSEGVVTGVRHGRRNLPVDADELINEITARGYEVDIGGCISRAWNVVKANLGIAVGATFLVMLCNQAAGFIPFLGIILSLMVQGPLMGGLNIFYLKMIRGEPASLGDAFSGFSQGFWRLCGTFLLMMLFVYVWMVPLGVYALVRVNRGELLTEAGFWILLVLGMVGLIYMAVACLFALFLSADLELGPWDSLRVSWRVVNQKWLALFGLTVVAGIVGALGIVACIIGIIFTLPIFYAATAYAYEDIFGVAPAGA